MKNIGIVINANKDKHGNVVSNVVSIVKSIFSVETVAIFDNPDIHKQCIKDMDFLIVLGGDGTILRSCQAAIEDEIPMLPINIGHLGFISTGDYSDIRDILLLVRDKEYYIEQRIALLCEYDKLTNERLVVLNEVVLSKGTFSRIVSFEINIDGVDYITYRGDGMIISTPTGSTAYALSAGGPIIEPTLSLISITPICPQNFGAKTLVLDSKAKVNIRIEDASDKVYIMLDGQEYIEIENKNSVTVSEYKKKVKFIRTKNYEYFDVLNSKILNKGKVYN